MRIAVAVLLLANVLFFGWGLLLDGGRSNGQRYPDGGGLKLASASLRPLTRCQRFGPFTDMNLAFSATAALGARGVKVEPIQAERRVTDKWTVFVTSAENRAARSAAMTALRRRGVRDVALIRSDAGERLAAGVFESEAGATERAAVVEKAGFQAAVEGNEHTVAERWLSAELSVNAGLPGYEDLGLAGDLVPRPAWGDCPAAKVPG